MRHDPDYIGERLSKWNKKNKGHGIECLRDATGEYGTQFYGDCIGFYVNMGDPYIPTLTYIIPLRKWFKCDLGDVIEKCEQKGIKFQ